MNLRISKNLEKYFKHFCFPSCVIMMCVYKKLRFSFSYRELEEMMSIHGVILDHATLQRWVFRFSDLINKVIRKRKYCVNSSWRMDETYIKVNGIWHYLYRAVDKFGDTIDFLLTEKRDTVAAKSFFRKAFKNNDIPSKINVDKSGSNKAALDYYNEQLSKEWQYEIRQVKYLNNICEQDHRFIKKRTKPMLGFKSFDSASATRGGTKKLDRVLRDNYFRKKGVIDDQYKKKTLSNI